MSDPKVLAASQTFLAWDNLYGDPDDVAEWAAHFRELTAAQEARLDEWARFIQQVICDARTPDENGMVTFSGLEVVCCLMNDEAEGE